MVDFNWYIIFISALVPLVIGFIWYNPKVFGNAWMKAADMSLEKAKGANMPLVFGLTYLFSLMASLVLINLTIHQAHMLSVFANDVTVKDPNSETGMFLSNFFQKYGTTFRTFKHGVFHGVIAGLFLIFPIIGINALFERKGFKYILINAGFWVVCLGLMGGIICGFL